VPTPTLCPVLTYRLTPLFHAFGLFVLLQVAWFLALMVLLLGIRQWSVSGLLASLYSFAPVSNNQRVETGEIQPVVGVRKTLTINRARKAQPRGTLGGGEGALRLTARSVACKEGVLGRPVITFAADSYCCTPSANNSRVRGKRK
jgi:hypothetical protein